ncbi:uncharacterized protein LOC143694105 [Agelaius phoeniceus]|uniref:uncharacterized protein LOC143694105 n=1 Tax=Agelaius phoeniceus TaxID=39638 RepID=UPI004054B03E
MSISDGGSGEVRHLFLPAASYPRRLGQPPLMPVETNRISSFCLRPGTKLGEICGDTGRYFDGLPRAGSGPCRHAGDGPGGVYGRAPSVRVGAAPAPPPPSPGVRGKGAMLRRERVQVACACLCALRCKGSYNYVLPSFPYPIDGGAVWRPSTRHLGSPLPPPPPRLQRSHSAPC